MKFNKTAFVIILIILLIPFRKSLSQYSYNLEDYREVLGLTVYFYGAQRCGNAHNWLLTDNSYGNSCHLLDGQDYDLLYDLTGGWHDAGDHIKFTLTIAWSAYVLLKGYETFREAYQDDDSRDYSGEPNSVPDLLDEVKTATDYLINANYDKNTMIARVGGPQDHDYWLTSPYQSCQPVSKGGGKRPVYSGAKADICGISAAALSMMSRLYRPYNQQYADSCLESALTIYRIAENNLASTADPDGFYEKSIWKDDMMCGAIELYRATEADSLLDDAEYYNSSYSTHGWVADWSNHWDYGRHSMVKAGVSGALTHWKEDVDRYLTKIANNTYVNGLAYFGEWGSLRYAANAALSAALLYDISGEVKYRNFAISQVDYIMGQNEYERSFIIGWGNNPPENPHHVNAYGRNAEDWDLSKLPLYTLFGALVGGPTKYSHDGVTYPGYKDDIHDYIGNEVTIDYNAGLIGAVAMIVYEMGFSEINNQQEPEVYSFRLYQNYPNPSNCRTEIKYSIIKKQRVRLAVFDALGREIKVLADGVKSPGIYYADFKADELPSGLYFYRLETKSKIATKKFILMK